MRIQECAWTIRLNAKDRKQHEAAFPSGREVPDIIVRRLLSHGRLYLVESVVDGRPVRLAKSGRWEHYDPNGTPAAAHKYATMESALNQIYRGTSPPQDMRLMEGAHAAA